MASLVTSIGRALRVYHDDNNYVQPIKMNYYYEKSETRKKPGSNGKGNTPEIE